MISSTKSKPHKVPTSLISLKCHFFCPSSRIIWTVVSKNNEYWIDLDLNYCSCSDYFFRTLSNKKICYHLRDAKKFYIMNNYQIYQFTDENYAGLIRSIVNDISLSLRPYIADKNSCQDKFLV